MPREKKSITNIDMELNFEAKLDGSKAGEEICAHCECLRLKHPYIHVQK
jgi:hypothetical protein